MSKIRVCPKCGKIESQFIYFCTECGWQTEAREMKNDYSTEQINEKSEMHIESNPPSIVMAEKLKEKHLIETNKDSHLDETASREEDEDKLIISRNVEVNEQKLSHLVEDAEEYYIDLLCPRCKTSLSYMNWLLREPVTCPMCNVIFRYDEKLNGVEIVHNYTSRAAVYDGSFISESQENYSVVEDQMLYKANQDTLDEEITESEEIELDGTFIDVVCRHCNARLSFFDWQVEEKELMCPICEKTFNV